MADEDEPLAAYVRKRIEEWEASGRTLNDLRDAAGMGKSSMVNQIKGGASVTETTGSKLAAPLGFTDFSELVVAAYKWRHGLLVDENNASPLVEAVGLATKYGISSVQIQRGIARVPEERRSSIDALAWLAIFHDERSIDARIDGELLAATRSAEAADRARQAKQKELRDTVERQKVKPKKARRIA